MDVEVLSRYDHRVEITELGQTIFAPIPIDHVQAGWLITEKCGFCYQIQTPISVSKQEKKGVTMVGNCQNDDL